MIGALRWLTYINVSFHRCWLHTFLMLYVIPVVAGPIWVCILPLLLSNTT